MYVISYQIYIRTEIFFFPATPMGQLPVLEVDGKQISQSLAIGRFLANKFNLAGTTPVEKFQADMIVECCKDFYDCKPFILIRLCFKY